MRVRAYLLSFLARQQLALEHGFAARYVRPWLVWEPGSWRPPEAEMSAVETQLPMARGPAWPGPRDALCFELSVKAPELRIGRGEGNELVVAEPTVSREHCTMRNEHDQWWVKACPDVKSLKVDGRVLAAGEETALQPGQTLELGDVKLTFWDASRFVARVTETASGY